MPNCASLIRIIRRRFVLGLIFILSLTYCAFSLLRNEKSALKLDTDLDDMDGMINDNNEDLISDDDTLADQLRASDKPPLWQMEVVEETSNENTLNADAISNLNDSDTTTHPCRNSIQGKILIVDERGVICARREVLPNGCCSTEQKQIPKDKESPAIIHRERYSCKTCNAQGCCAIYEYCVSCCLHPSKLIKGRKEPPQDNTPKDKQKVPKDEDAVRMRLRNLDRFQVCLAACRTSSASVRHENSYKDPHSKHCYTLQLPHAHQRHHRDVKALNNKIDSLRAVVTSSSVVLLLTSPSPFYYNTIGHAESVTTFLSSCDQNEATFSNYHFYVQPP